MAGILPHYLGRAASLLMKICLASKDLCCFPLAESTGWPDYSEKKNPDTHNTEGIPPSRTHVANPRPTGALWEERMPTLHPPSSNSDALSIHRLGGNRIATGDSHALQVTVLWRASCLQVPGNLPSHKKINIKNVSHRFRSPSTMELPQPYGRNYFFMPTGVQKTQIFQWIAKQTFAWFLLRFNNRL